MRRELGPPQQNSSKHKGSRSGQSTSLTENCKHVSYSVVSSASKLLVLTGSHSYPTEGSKALEKQKQEPYKMDLCREQMRPGM